MKHFRKCDALEVTHRFDDFKGHWSRGFRPRHLEITYGMTNDRNSLVALEWSGSG